MFLQGFVFLALCLTQSFQVNPPPQPATKEIDVFSGLASAAAGAVDSLFDKVDVLNIFNPIFNEIYTKIGTGSCMAGLYVNVDNGDMTLKLINGKISDLHLMTTRTKTIKEDADTITATVTFILPNLPIKYDFDYTSVRLIIKVERNGVVKLKQEGPVTVEFTVQLPKSQKKIEESKKSKKCVAKINSVKTSVNQQLTTVNVEYDSWANSLGLGVTGNSIKRMLTGLQEDLKNNIESAVQALIEPLFRGNAFNCNEASYTEPIDATYKNAISCRHVVTATKYKRQS